MLDQKVKTWERRELKMKQKAFFIISKLISLKQSFMDRESPTLSDIFTGLHYLVISVTSFFKKIGISVYDSWVNNSNTEFFKNEYSKSISLKTSIKKYKPRKAQCSVYLHFLFSYKWAINVASAYFELGFMFAWCILL